MPAPRLLLGPIARVALLFVLGTPTTSIFADTDWDGSESTDWFDSDNWTAGIPNQGDDVTIPFPSTNYPVLDASGAVCKSLVIEDGATLDLDTFSIEIRIDFDPQDSDVVLSTATGQLEFTGGTAGSILSDLTFAGDIRANKAAGVLTIQANVSCNDLVVAAGTCNLSPDGTTKTQTLSGNLTVNGSTTLDRRDATVDVAGNVTLNGTYDDSDADGGTFVAGNWTDSGTFTTGTQTVTFDGGGTSTISVPDSNDFHNITITNSTTASVTSDIDINGTLTINAGSTFDADGDLNVTGGAVTCSGTGRLQIGSTVTSLGTFTAGSGTVEYDDTGANRTVENVTYHHLEVDVSTRTVSLPGNITVGGGLTVTSGTLAVANDTLTVAGATDINATLTVSTGTLDANGSYDATGGTVTFTGAGRLQLGSTVTALGTFTESTSTVEYDDISANQIVTADTYFDLEIDNATRVALTGGNVIVTDDLTVTSGEFEVDDTDTLRVDDDISVTGILDLEPGAELQMDANTALTVNSGGTFEAIGSPTELVLVTSNNDSDRYAFSVDAGGKIDATHVYFRYMDANGIQITDNGAVTALTQLGNAFFDNGATGGRLLKITDNDNVVTLPNVQFFDTNSDLTYNVETVNASATITIDPYESTGNPESFGGPTNENDNGGGTVTPGFIVWGSTTPVRLQGFQARRVSEGVLLTWQTASEWHVLGFVLERAPAGAATRFERVGPPVIVPSTAVPDGGPYRFVDDQANRNSSRYRLLEIPKRGPRRLLATADVGPFGPGDRVRVDAPRLSTLIATAVPRRAASARRRTRITPPTAAKAQMAGHPRSAKILVDTAGVIRIPQPMLAAAGFPVDLDPQSWRLRRDSEPWPIWIEGEGDGTFDPQDAIDFVAVPFQSLETRFDVYWLEVALPEEDALRLPAVVSTLRPRFRPGGPGVGVAELDFEENDLYVPALTNGEGRDHWFWDFVSAPGSLEIPFEVDFVVPNQRAWVDIALEGWTEDLLAPLDHQTRIFVNDVDVGELVSNGAGPHGGTLEIPANVLAEGGNLLTLEAQALAVPNLVFLDGFRVRYPRFHQARDNRLRFTVDARTAQSLTGFEEDEIVLYQITGPDAPRRILGGLIHNESSGNDWSLSFLSPAMTESAFEAFTPAGSRHPAAIELPVAWAEFPVARGADYIVIAPSVLTEAIEPLVQLRESQGLRVAVVPLEQVYDRFGGGRPTTTALKEFLSWAASEWTRPALETVLLVGDATYDPRGNLGPSPRQVLPTRLIEGTSLQTASDNGFADLDDDGAPELAVGRLPVATLEECETVVAKILDYEGASPDQNPRMLFVADRGGDFHWMQQRLLDQVTPHGRRFRLRLGELEVTEVRNRLFALWQDGLTFVHYTGHGSRTLWSGEEILTIDDAPNLASGSSRFPVVIALNCLNGFFQHVNSPSLGEALLLAPAAGAIAYWGPTGLSSNLGQQSLAESFYAHFQMPSRGSLGQSLRHALRALAADPARRTLVDTWVLLGDPALRVFP